jgi:hypothetical protein
METFADVLHTLVDHTLSGDEADQAHTVIDQASGLRTPEPPAEEAPATTTEAPAETEAAPSSPEVAPPL